MNCPNCKNPIQSNDIDCQWCGAKLNNVSASTSQISHELTDNPSGNTVRDSSLLGNINFQTLLKSKNLKWVGIIILGLAFIIIVVSNISSSSENSYRINSDDYESSYEENEDQVLSEDIIPESEKTETEDIIIDNEHQQSSERSYYQEPLEVIEEQPQISRNRLEIGDYHEGGIIFYLDYSGQHGKVVAEENLGKFFWKEAKRRCENLVLNNYSDWYLPTKEDLEMMYNQRPTISWFEYEAYWSSTVKPNSGPWWINLISGESGYDYENGIDEGTLDPFLICPVRAF
jgi:hypothetical protein